MVLGVVSHDVTWHQQAKQGWQFWVVIKKQTWFDSHILRGREPRFRPLGILSREKSSTALHLAHVKPDRQLAYQSFERKNIYI